MEYTLTKPNTITKTQSKQSKNAYEATGKETYKRLFSYVLKYKLFFAIAILGMVITSLADMSFAAMLKPIIDNGFVNNDRSSIAWLPYIIIMVFVFRGVGVFLDTYFLTWVARKTVGDLRMELFNKALDLPSSYFDSQPSSTIISKIIFDVEQVASSCTSAIKTLVKDMVLLVGLLSWLLYLNAKLTLVMFVALPIAFFLVRAVTKRFRSISHDIQESVQTLAEITKEVVLGHRIVKTFGGNKYEVERFKAANDENLKFSLKRSTVSAINLSLILLLVGASIAIILFLAMKASINGEITPGSFISYLTTMVMMLSPTKRLAKINETLQIGVAGAASMFSAIDEEREINEGSITLREKIAGKIDFNNVSFNYQSNDAFNFIEENNLAPSSDVSETNKEELILDNINFSIKPGQSVALVGASGSGKSTIVSLLLRFYNVENGSITLDDNNINDITLGSLRNQFAMVSQDIVLFNDSIKNNIVYGAEDNIDEARLAYVCEAAYLNEFIDNLPEGLETVVGERGTRLSGGQRQRLAIARAFYKDAPILVMDEATSALDSESEKYVQQAVEALMKNRTSIIIAHRLSTIRNVDKVVVLEKGKVVETGSIDELMSNKDGAYYRYYKTQFAD